MITITATHVLLAGALDFAIGDPRWIPHPVRIIGRAISAGERILRRFCSTPYGERMAGALLVLIIVAPVYLLAAFAVYGMSRLSAQGAALIGAAAMVWLIATTIAARELICSVRQVVASIAEHDLEKARRNVGMIVGRDTHDLDESGVLRAAVESLAENLSDGVVAPLFYLAVGGLPLAMVYKAVNTLDSMVGYKNEKYRNFGWTAARLDDAANYIPARLTGILIVGAVFLYSIFKQPRIAAKRMLSAWQIMMRDGKNHSSPNSGVPEAAMAGALNVRLGGSSKYNGVVMEKPFINGGGAVCSLDAASEGITLAKITSLSAVLSAAFAVWFRSGI